MTEYQRKVLLLWLTLEYGRIYSEGECILHHVCVVPEEAKATATSTGKWALFYGIHRGTLVSRDCDTPEFQYRSYQDCITALIQNAVHFEQLGGYKLWFAQAIAPDGRQHKILNGAHYAAD
jgi:hypothetical protein